MAAKWIRVFSPDGTLQEVTEKVFRNVLEAKGWTLEKVEAKAQAKSAPALHQFASHAKSRKQEG